MSFYILPSKTNFKLVPHPLNSLSSWFLNLFLFSSGEKLFLQPIYSILWNFLVKPLPTKSLHFKDFPKKGKLSGCSVTKKLFKKIKIFYEGKWWSFINWIEKWWNNFWCKVHPSLALFRRNSSIFLLKNLFTKENKV